MAKTVRRRKARSRRVVKQRSRNQVRQKSRLRKNLKRTRRYKRGRVKSKQWGGVFQYRLFNGEVVPRITPDVQAGVALAPEVQGKLRAFLDSRAAASTADRAEGVAIAGGDPIAVTAAATQAADKRILKMRSLQELENIVRVTDSIGIDQYRASIIRYRYRLKYGQGGVDKFKQIVKSGGNNFTQYILNPLLGSTVGSAGTGSNISGIMHEGCMYVSSSPDNHYYFTEIDVSKARYSQGETHVTACAITLDWGHIEMVVAMERVGVTPYLEFQRALDLPDGDGSKITFCAYVLHNLMHVENYRGLMFHYTIDPANESESFNTIHEVVNHVPVSTLLEKADALSHYQFGVVKAYTSSCTHKNCKTYTRDLIAEMEGIDPPLNRW
jgi:hypothetical protein